MTPTRSHILSMRRVVAAVFALVCLGINAIGLYYVWQEHKMIEEILLSATAEYGQMWANQCAELLGANDRARLQQLVQLIGHGRDTRLALVADRRGRVIASTDQRYIGERLSHEHTGLYESGVKVVELHPTPKGFFH